MFLSDHKVRTLRALRNEPLEHAELTLRLERAPYHVRAELDDLKRDRLVRKVFERRRVTWQLTELGHAELNRADQLTIENDGGAR